MPKPYETYTFDQLVTDSDFIEWVKHPTLESERFWQGFADKYPSKVMLVNQARQAVQLLVLASKQDAPLTEAPIIWSTIEQRSMPIVRRINWGRWVAAACTALVLGIGCWLWFEQSHLANPIAEQIARENQSITQTISNQSQIDRLITLPDQSTVILKPNSQLRFTKTFAGKPRQVYLVGEAFFKVTRNVARPFKVYANGLVTKVLGTSFRIKAIPQAREVTVDVQSGRVAVFVAKGGQEAVSEAEGLILIPNQKAVFQKEAETLTKTLVEKPEVIISEKELGRFVFKNAPLEEIFRAMEKAYGVTLIYDQDQLENCHLTTTLIHTDLFKALDVICAGVDATYTVIDAQIIISSGGCQ